MDVPQFRRHVLAPTLAHIAQVEPRLDVPAAHELVIGTLLKESLLTYLHQLGGGPARGFGQMEPETHAWMRSWLMRKPHWRAVFAELVAPWPREAVDHLYTSLPYMVAMTRLRYWVVPEALPVAHDVEGLAHYWDRYYQTVPDDVQPAQWARLYREHAMESRPT